MRAAASPGFPVQINPRVTLVTFRSEGSAGQGSATCTGPSSLPEELEPLGIMVVPSFAELRLIFKSIIK